MSVWGVTSVRTTFVSWAMAWFINTNPPMSGSSGIRALSSASSACVALETAARRRAAASCTISCSRSASGQLLDPSARVVTLLMLREPAERHPPEEHDKDRRDQEHDLTATHCRLPASRARRSDTAASSRSELTVNSSRGAGRAHRREGRLGETRLGETRDVSGGDQPAADGGLVDADQREGHVAGPVDGRAGSPRVGALRYRGRRSGTSRPASRSSSRRAPRASPRLPRVQR